MENASKPQRVLAVMAGIDPTLRDNLQAIAEACCVSFEYMADVALPGATSHVHSTGLTVPDARFGPVFTKLIRAMVHRDRQVHDHPADRESAELALVATVATLFQTDDVANDRDQAWLKRVAALIYRRLHIEVAAVMKRYGYPPEHFEQRPHDFVDAVLRVALLVYEQAEAMQQLSPPPAGEDPDAKR